MAKVFVSYSRKDIDFTKHLTGELKKSNLEFWVDWEGIPPTVDFMKKIEKGIEESDIFLFLVSPDSAISKVCGEEIAHAIKNGKRLIPLIVRDIRSEEIPQALSHLNWIFFREQDNFEESFQKLLLGINTDFDWVDVHSRLLVRALEWEQANKDNSFLLRGKDLHDAETQLATNTSKDPHPTDLHREYILKSRQAADRQRRWYTVIAVVIAIVFFVLGVIGITQAIRANANAEEAKRSQQQAEIAKNHALAKEIESEINQLSALAVTKIDQNFNEALFLGVEAYLHTKENKVTSFTAQDAMTKILQSNPGLIKILLGHTDSIYAMAISPDGNILASSGFDSVVILWDISNPAAPEKLTTLNDATSAVFSSDGKILAISSTTGLSLWDISDPSNPKSLSTIEGNYSGIDFTQDDQTLSSIKYDENGMGTVVLFNISNKKSPVESTQLATGDENIYAVNLALNADRNLLFAALDNGNILIWDIADTLKPLLLFTMEGNEEYISSLAISVDGQTLAIGRPDTTIALWDITDPTAPAMLNAWSGHSLPITSLAFSADGNTLASSSDEPKSRIILWDISDRKSPRKTRTINGHSLVVTSLIFSPKDGILISGSFDNTIMLWDVSDPKSKLELGSNALLGSDESLIGFAFKPNSKILTVSYYDAKLETSNLAIWDVSDPANPKKTRTLDVTINIEVFSRDGKLMASSGDNNIVTLWDATDFVKLSTVKTDTDNVNAIELSTDGKTLAVIGRKIIFWDITDPKKPLQLTVLSQQDDEMADMVFNSDGKFMASIADKNIVLWDVLNPAKPVRLSALEGHTSAIHGIVFSPTNPNLLASASDDKTIILWDIADPHNPKKIKTLGNHSDYVTTISFSPDGTMLASGSFDKQINLWNVSNPEAPALVSKMIGHTSSIDIVTFTPFGDFIASSDGNEIIFWDINPESWAQKSCSIAEEELTLIEWNQFFPAEDYRQTCESFAMPQSITQTESTLVPAPTVEQSSVPLPVCTSDQIPSCTLPTSDKLDEFCVDKNSYGLYQLPLNTTFEVLTPGFTCISETNNKKGEPRISCTGPTNKEFQVSFCNSSCSSTLETSNQCEAGFGLDSAQGCCAPLSTANNGCVTETLKLVGCN